MRSQSPQRSNIEHDIRRRRVQNHAGRSAADALKGMRVGIVGGGVAGAFSAWLALLMGATKVTVLERNAALGGRVRSVPLGGVVAEMGAM